jgi:hypothetical protein
VVSILNAAIGLVGLNSCQSLLNQLTYVSSIIGLCLELIFLSFHSNLLIDLLSIVVQLVGNLLATLLPLVANLLGPLTKLGLFPLIAFLGL